MKWYNDKAQNLDVVLYSTLTLLRNLNNTPFPSRMDNDMRKAVSKKVFAVIKNSQYATDFDMYNVDNLGASDVDYAVDKGIISKALAKQNKGCFILNKDESISIVLNEDEHIKLTGFSSGMSMDTLYDKIDEIDNVLLNSLKIAYNKKLGFLTSSPLKVGTGLQASFVLHLPALTKLDRIESYSELVSKLGVSLAPKYKNALGDEYVLTNLITIGLTEKDMIKNLEAICNQLVDAERKAREIISKDNDTVDLIYRNLGILKLARKVSQAEFLSSSSLIRLGASLDFFDLKLKDIDKMRYELLDSALLCQNPNIAGADECDIARADILREKLS